VRNRSSLEGVPDFRNVDILREREISDIERSRLNPGAIRHFTPRQRRRSFYLLKPHN
jgi:hypothetical protein